LPLPTPPAEGRGADVTSFVAGGGGGEAAAEATPSNAPSLARGDSYQGELPTVSLVPGTVNEDGTRDILVRVLPPDSTDGSRPPSDVVCVVDVSGSMAKSATIQATKGEAAQEDDGLTILDVTKHAVRTIINTLKPTDNFALVSYSSTATTCLSLTSMNEAGKRQASAELDKLTASGGTNLWDGLHKGMEEIRTSGNPSRGSAVLLLTDGCPNVVPPRGHQAMLCRYKDSNPDMNCSISTFGFGYSLDSELLNELAIIGNGQYSFIPDAGFVGTTFVHAASNILSTVARRVVLKISHESDPNYGVTAKAETDSTLSGLGSSVSYPSWGVQVECGTLTAGQTKDVVVRATDPAGLCVDLDLVLNGSTELVTLSADAASAGVADEATEETKIEVLRERNRLEFVDMVMTVNNYMAIGEDAQAQATVAAFGCKLKAQAGEQLAAAGTSPSGASGVAIAAATDAYTVELIKDVTGQVTEATSRRDWYDKWGKHYLPSLAQAHRLQQCNNFKDPGVQAYGGALFNLLRDEADAIFMKLPPPTPTGLYNQYGGGGGGGYRGFGGATKSRARNAEAVAARPVVNMSYYNNRNAGCFHGGAQVELADGRTKRCDQIARGDLVRTSTTDPKQSAKVMCVVETAIKGGHTELTRLPTGLLATPWHPVRTDDSSEWRFPVDVPGAETKSGVACGSVFSFVLEKPSINGSMVIGGLECITLGNSFTGPVAGHAYFSSPRVVEDLQAMRGYTKGHVRFQPNPLTRDAKTGLLVGYRADREAVRVA